MDNADQEIAKRRQVLKLRVKKVLALLAVVGLVVWIAHPSGTSSKKFMAMNGTIPVGAAVAEKGDIGVTLNALGTVTSLASITVKNQIAGVLTKVGFEEGQMVKAGDFLAEIDPRPYQAAMAQVEGQLAKDQAQLVNAQEILERDRKLIDSGAVSQQDLEAQEASVKQLEGTVKADEAQVDAAKLNLAYCRIVAPASARVGIRQVDPGNYVAVGTQVVTLTQMQPITVLFSVPENRVQEILNRRKENAAFVVEALDRDQKTILAVGKVTSIDNQIDTATGTIRMRATFDNKEENLFPNGFVNVRLHLNLLKDVVMVPTTAIQKGSIGTFVYLIGGDSKVSVKPVAVGASDGDKIQITDGLSVGDRVVTDGTDKLRDGATVTVPADKAAAPDEKKAEAAKADKPKKEHKKGAEGAP
jgi:multidrug efflux system membrane fusion protein